MKQNRAFTLLKTDAKKELSNYLIPLYGEREAANIAQIVFEDIFGAFLGAELKEEELIILKEVKSRLLSGEPVQYITGFADFYGLGLKVNSHVLIPRPETEELIHWIIKDLGKPISKIPGFSILDIGTGSGCIPVTLKKYLPEAKITGIDISPQALKVAAANSVQLNLDVEWRQLDILDESEWANLEKFDVIVSNPPYIPDAEKSLMHPNVLEYEPHLALFVRDEDPMLFYRKIIEFAKNNLDTGGWLYFEINEFKAEAVLKLLNQNGFKDIVLNQDLQGKPRMVKAHLT